MEQMVCIDCLYGILQVWQPVDEFNTEALMANTALECVKSWSSMGTNYSDKFMTMTNVLNVYMYVICM